MDKTLENKRLHIEDRHWWTVVRRDAIVRLLAAAPRASRILDIGCAGGHLLSDLKARGFTDLHGGDISGDAVRSCRERGLTNIRRLDGGNPDLPAESFDVIIASDVLEHIEDDLGAAKRWAELLKPGGMALVFVPAYSLLWCEHDVANQHFRRYSRRSLRTVLQAAGLEVERASGWNFVMFFPAVIARVGERIWRKFRTKPSKDKLRRLRPLPNRLMIGLLRSENRVLRFSGFPVGVSVFAVARKPALVSSLVERKPGRGKAARTARAPLGAS